MKIPTYQIGNNLRIEGDKVISYSTVVARIKDNKLLVNGKYSRTTTKHLCMVRNLLGLGQEYMSEKKKDFCYYERGVKCNEDKRYISPVTSIKILQGRKDGKCLLESLIAHKTPKKDWEIIKEHLHLPDDCEPPHKGSIKWQKIETQL